MKDMVQLLIEKGANLNVKNEWGQPPLEWLWSQYFKNDAMDIVQLMVRNGAEMIDLDAVTRD